MLWWGAGLAERHRRWQGWTLLRSPHKCSRQKLFFLRAGTLTGAVHAAQLECDTVLGKVQAHRTGRRRDSRFSEVQVEALIPSKAL